MDKDAYQEKMQAKLDEWQAEMDKLKAQSREASAEHAQADSIRKRSRTCARSVTRCRRSTKGCMPPSVEGVGKIYEKGADQAWDNMAEGDEIGAEPVQRDDRRDRAGPGPPVSRLPPRVPESLRTHGRVGCHPGRRHADPSMRVEHDPAARHVPARAAAKIGLGNFPARRPVNPASRSRRSA
ncbi:MAG: hypothetical protein U5O39_05105 [Gammaproteobacteria bacterium]|nr:hypothetical protein [Gammaproteobacteria bacterium]